MQRKWFGRAWVDIKGNRPKCLSIRSELSSKELLLPLFLYYHRQFNGHTRRNMRKFLFRVETTYPFAVLAPHACTVLAAGLLFSERTVTIHLVVRIVESCADEVSRCTADEPVLDRTCTVRGGHRSSLSARSTLWELFADTFAGTMQVVDGMGHERTQIARNLSRQHLLTITLRRSSFDNYTLRVEHAAYQDKRLLAPGIHDGLE